MSQSQKWPLSQNAHKSSGECSVSHDVRQLHNSIGTVHRHGPRHNPCSGSDKPPVTVNTLHLRQTAVKCRPSANCGRPGDRGRRASGCTFFSCWIRRRSGPSSTQHILEMVNCREALIGFVNCLIHGEIHPLVSSVLFGGNLIALEKKTGCIRPTAVGYTLRRIAAKCANSYAASQLADYFSLIRLEVGTPGGCRPQSMPPDVTLKPCKTDAWW